MGIHPYIIIAQQQWQINLGSNARNLTMEFSKNNPVMYVNPAIDIKTIFKETKTINGKRRLKLAIGIGNNTIQVADNVWVHTPSTINYSINWIKNILIYNVLNKQNARGFFKSLKNAINKLGWKNDQCIVINDSQMFVGLHTKTLLNPLLNFYYIRDNLVGHPYFKYHGTRIEPLTIKNADAVFTNSSYLADYASLYNINTVDIGQGCELEIYDAEIAHIVPEDIKLIPLPRIGYIGFLTGERLDIDLLEQLAQTKKEWNWILIGPEEIMFQQSKLHSMSNVYFLGTKKIAHLPAYIQQLDVCINPQLINALTIGNYPRKIDEYLALGKPTVATNTPAMKMFLPHVHLAVSTKEYIKAIEIALIPPPKEQVAAAVNFAKNHTWQHCIEKIDAVKNKMLNA